MKKLYSTIMMLALMVAALGFTACGGGDDEQNGGQKPPSSSTTSGDGGDEESGGQETPSSSVEKCLIRVTYGNMIWDYAYDNQGRVIQIKRKIDYQENGRVSCTYVYKNNSVIETIYENDFSYENIYTLDDGRIIEMYDGDTNITYQFGYQNGYLVLDAEPREQRQYKWSDGELMKVDYVNEKTGETKTRETYEYTNYKCPQGFFPFGHSAHICGRWGLSGLLGKTMKNLPSKHTEDDITEIYDWVIQDGLPIKMILTAKVPHMSESQATYTFDWN